MQPDRHYVLVRFYLNAYRMGDLEGHFITTPAKLEAIKQLPSTYFHDVLGKHSEIRVKFDEKNLLTIVSEDQGFIREAARVFKVSQATGYLLGFNPFECVWDGEWETADEMIPVPWFGLEAPDPEAV